MPSRIQAVIALGLMFALGIAAVVLSIAILREGKLYHRLNPQKRPRRWVLMSLLVLFGVFAVWFPIWILWPRLMVLHLLTLVFAITFGVVGLALKKFSP